MKFCPTTFQCERFVKMMLNIAAHRLHHSSRAVASNRPGPAAQTGTVPCLFGLVGLAEKCDVLSAGTPGWARRAAIDAGRGDGKNKTSVLIGVAVHNRLPIQVLIIFL